MSGLDPRFGRDVLEALDADARRARLLALEFELDGRLLPHQDDWNTFWAEATAIIGALRALGHDLHSHDVDGHRRHLWGWNYMTTEGQGSLQIQFDIEGSVLTFWRTVDPQLGVFRVEDVA